MNDSKKAQVWFLDFMIGILILSMTLGIYFTYEQNLVSNSNDDWHEIVVSSKSISSSLMSEGSPSNWTAENVSIVGLTDGNYRINQTKLDQFTNMSYNDARQALMTRFGFYFFIEDKNGSIIRDAGVNSTGSKFLVQTTRLVIYNSSVSRMVIYLWSENKPK